MVTDILEALSRYYELEVGGGGSGKIGFAFGGHSVAAILAENRRGCEGKVGIRRGSGDG